MTICLHDNDVAMPLHNHDPIGFGMTTYCQATISYVDPTGNYCAGKTDDGERVYLHLNDRMCPLPRNGYFKEIHAYAIRFRLEVKWYSPVPQVGTRIIFVPRKTKKGLSTRGWFEFAPWAERYEEFCKVYEQKTVWVIRSLQSIQGGVWTEQEVDYLFCGSVKEMLEQYPCQGEHDELRNSAHDLDPRVSHQFWMRYEGQWVCYLDPRRELQLI